MRSKTPLKTAKRPTAAAVVTIHGAGRMTPEGRKAIAAWLREHAKALLKDGARYTEGRYTGRYISVPMTGA